MKLEKWNFFLQWLPIVAAALISLANGGFNVGTQLANFGAELKLLRHEVVAQNALQDLRLDRLEKNVIKPETSKAEESLLKTDSQLIAVAVKTSTESGQLKVGKDQVNTIELDKLKDVCKINGKNCIEECSSRFERFSRGNVGFYECRFLPKDYFI